MLRIIREVELISKVIKNDPTLEANWTSLWRDRSLFDNL